MSTQIPPHDERLSGDSPAMGTPPPIPAAPPTQPGELSIAPRRPVWPTPIGIITIVLSAWTCLSAFQSVMMGFGGQIMATTAAGGEDEAMMQALEEAGPYMITSGVLLAIAAGLGIAGGIGLLMRMRWGVLVLFVFATWKIIASGVHALIQANWMSVMMEASMQSAGQPGAGMPPPGMMSGFGAMMAVMTFIFGAAYPIFILVWMMLPNIKQDYRGW